MVSCHIGKRDWLASKLGYRWYHCIRNRRRIHICELLRFGLWLSSNFLIWIADDDDDDDDHVDLSFIFIRLPIQLWKKVCLFQYSLIQIHLFLIVIHDRMMGMRMAVMKMLMVTIMMMMRMMAQLLISLFPTFQQHPRSQKSLQDLKYWIEFNPPSEPVEWKGKVQFQKHWFRHSYRWICVWNEVV